MNSDTTDNPLAPLINLCREKRGTKTEVLRMFNQNLNNKMATWSMVSGWLHHDANLRTMPTFHAGLALLDIQNKLCAKPKAAGRRRGK